MPITLPSGKRGGHFILREHLLALAAVKIPLEHSPEVLVSERGGGNWGSRGRGRGWAGVGGGTPIRADRKQTRSFPDVCRSHILGFRVELMTWSQATLVIMRIHSFTKPLLSTYCVPSTGRTVVGGQALPSWTV